ncbi:MAG: mannonate dehydratase [Treponemataceae bacterium]
MRMSFRWFGSGFDPIPLKHIRQIPGVEGVVTTLYDMKPGEQWPVERIRAVKAEVAAAGLRISGIESVNIHDSIKAGLPERDKHIETYIETIKRLGEAGIDLVCYNFMPVFDWTRSDLAKVRPDGATVFAYDQAEIDKIDPTKMFDKMKAGAGGFALPGWEPERLAKIGELFRVYRDVDEEALFANLKYFLQAVMPTCEKYNLKLAIHPDDPAWPVFGLPRIATSKERLLRIVGLVDSPYSGVTLCTGSLGSNPENDIPDTIRSLKGKIHFAHVRNVKHRGPGVFEESAHLSVDGSLDMFAIMLALHDIGFTGPIRPDHGRDIWGEKGMPGYGLYDRALGIAYLNGLSEAIAKMKKSG